MSLVRHRFVGGGPGRRGRRLSELSVPRDLLRPVVDRTLAVVRAGVRARPPVPAPATDTGTEFGGPAGASPDPPPLQATSSNAMSWVNSTKTRFIDYFRGADKELNGSG